MNAALLRVLCVVLVAAGVVSQPGGDMGGGDGGGASGDEGVSGEEEATTCTTTDCGSEGLNNEVTVSMTWDEDTGKFSGTITTNLCPAHASDVGTEGECITQTFPAPAYTDGPSATLLRGRIGLTLYGVNVYGPMEAGFGPDSVEPCETDGEGLCLAGMDVNACEETLNYQCGADIISWLMLDSCGGHAVPYHYHGSVEDPAIGCDYDSTASGHSPLIGFALDGYGIYGLNEDGEGEYPTDLDACGGHYGPVPANDEYGIVAGYYYHYHVQNEAPYTLGCFGSGDITANVTIDECKTLYDECNTGYTIAVDPDGVFYCYDLDCPCYEADGTNTDISVADCLLLDTYESTFPDDADPFTGTRATPTPTSAPTDSPTASPDSTDSPTSSPTDAPTTSPTDSPTSSPTDSPTSSPTDAPSTPTPASPTTATPASDNNSDSATMPGVAVATLIAAVIIVVA